MLLPSIVCSCYLPLLLPIPQPVDVSVVGLIRHCKNHCFRKILYVPDERLPQWRMTNDDGDNFRMIGRTMRNECEAEVLPRKTTHRRKRTPGKNGRTTTRNECEAEALPRKKPRQCKRTPGTIGRTSRNECEAEVLPRKAAYRRKRTPGKNGRTTTRNDDAMTSQQRSYLCPLAASTSCPAHARAQR